MLYAVYTQVIKQFIFGKTENEQLFSYSGVL